MNCRNSTRMLSEARERDLTPSEREEVEQHLEICPACQRCQRQFDELGQALRRFAVQ